MAVIKRADAETMTRQAIVLDLGDLARQGERMRQEAASDAQKIRLEAEAHRRKLIRGAADEGRREGFEKGLAEGRAQGLEEGRAQGLAEMTPRLQAVETAWATGLEELGAARGALLSSARTEVLRLALTIAERITRRQVEIDRGAVEGPIEAALELISSATRAVVCVHPDDEAMAREALPKLASRLDAARHAEVRAEAGVARGGCVLRTPGGAIVDADIETQIERVVGALRVGAGIGAGEAGPVGEGAGGGEA